MDEQILPRNVPEWLQKDLLCTRHEVPVADGGSEACIESYYSPRLMRWAVQQWLQYVPTDFDPAAFRKTLVGAMADTRTFHAYLGVPEAFGEVYLEELEKENLHRVERDQVVRLFRRGPYGRIRGLDRRSLALLFGTAAIAALAFLY